jgi:hypothetical protein
MLAQLQDPDAVFVEAGGAEAGDRHGDAQAPRHASIGRRGEGQGRGEQGNDGQHRRHLARHDLERG